MYRDKERYKQDPKTVLRSKSNFDAPLSWKEPRLIFTCSWSDWFIKDADAWRLEAWEIIRRTPQHTYQILTKRPERVSYCLPDFAHQLQNVWIGVSIESWKEKHRINELLNEPCSVPEHWPVFVSAEPLIDEIDFLRDDIITMGNFHCIDWLIIGGESGNESGKYRYRPCKLEWIEDLIEQANDANIPVFVKQLGTHLSKELSLKDRHGGNIDEFPQWLQIRKMPSVAGQKIVI